MTTNLANFQTRTDALTLDERRTVENYLLGYVASSVPADVWDAGLSGALDLVARDRAS